MRISPCFSPAGETYIFSSDFSIQSLTKLPSNCVFELGDCLWYIAALAHELDSSLAEVTNGEKKLSGRQQRNIYMDRGTNVETRKKIKPFFSVGRISRLKN